jgi:hypothetical protein
LDRDLLENLYFIAGIVVALPIAAAIVHFLYRKLKPGDPLKLSRWRFLEKNLDLARAFKSRFEFSKDVLRLVASAKREVVFVAMGAGTLVDIRGRDYFEKLVARKLSESDFDSFTVVMWNPSSTAFSTRLSQIKEQDRESGRQSVMATFAFMRLLASRYPAFKLRVYNDSFQPTLLFLAIDREYIWISPYLNEIYGKHSPLVLEFHKGGEVFRELLHQVDLLTQDWYTTSVGPNLDH